MTDERPHQIGPYRLLDVLGEGGMGTVYLAEQQEPVRMRVALKLIKLGMDSKAVITRFEHERQALALMRHDGIAKVFNCGTSERGQPYFVMELVKGVPLTHFCDQNRLSLPQRLGLMQQVCAAVQHAHQKGVVHRDLKPGNVLVGDEGGKLQIKIIDFGLAKALGKRLVEATLFTEAGQIVGTPEYMAPEQADPTNQDIDTRVDIYSLGVMLYEVLAGTLPFASNELRQAGMLEVQRILREVEPPKPSTKLMASKYTAAAIADTRRLSVSALVRVLERDLDWVAMKALEKDRNRRYETANALSMDLQRFLDHEPLVAGPPSAGYRLRKLVRRYRGQFLAASAVLLVLLGGSIGTFVQYLRAEEKAEEARYQEGVAQGHEREATRRAKEYEKLALEKSALAAAEGKAKKEAQKNAAEAAQLANELEEVLAFQEEQWSEVDSASMGMHLRRSMLATARESRRADLEAGLSGVNFTDVALGMLQENLFDRSLAAIGKGFAEEPLVKARLLQSVADTLQDLGLLDRATAPQAEALEIRQRTLGDDDPDTLTSINNTSALLRARGKLAEAEPLCREALEKRRRLLGDDHRQTLVSINSMGLLFEEQGRLTEAEQLYRESLARRRRILGDDHRQTLSAINNLGALLQAQRRLTEAELLCRESLEKRRRILGDDDPSTLFSISSMGLLLKAQGKFSAAEPLFREALEGSRRIRGDDHPNTLKSISNVGALLEAQGRLTEAEPFHREAMEKCRQILGDDHPDTLNAITTMGTLLEAQGRMTEAEPLIREAFERCRRVLRDDHPTTLKSIGNMGSLLHDQGEYAKAETFYREALDKGRQVLGDDHPSTLAWINNLGLLLKVQGRFGEAEPLYREVLEKRRRLLGDDNPSTLISINNLAALLHGQGRLTDAEPLHREALEGFRRTLGGDHADTLSAVNNLGVLLRTQGRLGEAEALFREALATSRRALGDDHALTLGAILNLGRVLLQTGRHGEAVALLSAHEVAARRVFTGGGADRLAAFLVSHGKALAGLGQDLAAAEGKLLEAHTILTRLRGPAHRDTRSCAQSLVDFYTAWHAAEPRRGHDQQAAQWKAKLEPSAPERAKEASK